MESMFPKKPELPLAKLPAYSYCTLQLGNDLVCMLFIVDARAVLQC
jgi:hypothetical protein